MWQKIKCWWLGHKYRLVSRIIIRRNSYSKQLEDHCFYGHNFTIFLYQCDACDKFKEFELKGDYPDIPVDDLINTR